MGLQATDDSNYHAMKMRPGSVYFRIKASPKQSNVQSMIIDNIPLHNASGTEGEIKPVFVPQDLMDTLQSIRMSRCTVYIFLKHANYHEYCSYAQWSMQAPLTSRQCVKIRSSSLELSLTTLR